MGTYRLGRRFAIGGMAEVYLASTVGVGGFSKPVAVKRVLPHMAEDQAFVEHFMQEARLTESLQHRNIVQVLDLGTQAGEPYMILELVDGENLRTVLKECARTGQGLELREAVCIAMQVAEGLAHAHESTAPDGRPLGLVHRDINPANVLLASNGEVKLADFGIARAAEMASDTQAGVVKGKPGYLSPEQVRGRPAGQPSDVFLLGLLLHELLTGRALFHGLPFFQAIARIKGFHPSQLERPEGLPDALWTLLGNALMPRPEERLGSARAFAEALEDLLFAERLRVGPRDLAALLARVFPQRVSLLRDMGLKQGRVLSLDPWSVALSPARVASRDEGITIAAADAVLEERVEGEDAGLDPEPSDEVDEAFALDEEQAREPGDWDVSIALEGVEATAFRPRPAAASEQSGALRFDDEDSCASAPTNTEFTDDVWPQPPPTEGTHFLEADQFELIDEGAHAHVDASERPELSVAPSPFEFAPDEVDALLACAPLGLGNGAELEDVGDAQRVSLTADRPRRELLPELASPRPNAAAEIPSHQPTRTSSDEVWQHLLGAALMAVSPHLGEQGPQVATLAVRIAVGLGLPATQVGEVRLAALTLALGTGLDATHGTPSLVQLKTLLGEHWPEASHALEGCGLFGAEIAEHGPGLALAAALEVSRTGGTPAERSDPQATLDAIRREGRLPVGALAALQEALCA